MSTALVGLVPLGVAAVAGLLRLVVGARRLAWARWEIDRAIAADQRGLGAAPPSYAGSHYAALVRQLEGNTEGRPVIDTRAGVVDLTRLEQDPSALLIDDLVNRDIRNQLNALRPVVVQDQLAHQRLLGRSWLVCGDSDVAMVGVIRLERQILRVVNLEDPAVQLHLTVQTLAFGVGLGGERAEIAAVLVDAGPIDLIGHLERLLRRDGRRPVYPVARLGLRGTGFFRCRGAPGLSTPSVRRRLLGADPSAPLDGGLVSTVRSELAAAAAQLVEAEAWCRIDGPALGAGLWCRFRSTVTVNASSPHWPELAIARPAAGRSSIGVPPEGGPGGLAA